MHSDSVDQIKQMIENYKNHIAITQLKDEVYKWKLIEEYKGRPNLDAEDLHVELKSIDYSNLIYHLSKATLNQMMKAKPEEIRKLFVELFDESIDLTKRIKDFSEKTKVLYNRMGETNPHHQDERAVSAYLTVHNPKKYTFYKHSFYSEYCNLLGIKKEKKNKKYAHYLKLIDELVEKYIVPDKKLIELVKSTIPKYYDGTNNKLLAQDILYQMLEKDRVINYWIFQGNPDRYDFKSAIEAGVLDNWSVTAHRDKIEPGDKVIIWITGEEAGCYALAEVMSTPYENDGSADDVYWKDELPKSDEFKCDIEITHYFSDNPILKNEIKSIAALSNLKVGNQGTNFRATKEEYDIFVNLRRTEDSNNHWLYSPGSNANKWDEFYEKEIMAIGWGKIGDIRQYSNKDDIRVALTNAYGGTGSKVNDVLANYEFLHKMEIGDIIIVKRGLQELLGYGIVSSDYIYDETEEEFNSVRKIDWKLKGVWKTDFIMFPKTLTNITGYRTEGPYETYGERLLGIMGVNSVEPSTKDTSTGPVSQLNYTLNTIFYGPPGTGKTYHSIKRAAEIVSDREIDDYEEARKIFNDKLHDNIEFITFHQNYSYEDFIQGLRPDVDNKDTLTFKRRDGIFKLIADRAFQNIVESKNNSALKKNYVIVIDEINRANISRVFGELITLIEDDKRYGNKISMEVKLPSGDMFTVPYNLYIIGTMNTADKSIALLDIALRRRFYFEPMYPIYELEDSQIKDVDVLQKINDQIIKNKGHDFQIGHSYFMGKDDLKERMNNKVIPLLLEYYMNDEKEVSNILINAGLLIEDNSWPLRITGSKE